MNPVNLLRYINGYVCFSAEGGFVERFFNLCTANKILLWDTAYTANKLYSKCAEKNIGELRRIARKSGVRLKFQSISGLYFDLKKQSDKVGLLGGILFFIAFFSYMSCFVWSIDVTGNYNIPSEAVKQAAEKYGLYVGTYKPAFDETSAANALSQNSNGEFDWCAFNIKGSRATIEIREHKESIREKQVKEPCNIISDKDGIILNIEAYEGIAEASEGDAVKKGDMLINGAADNEDMSVLFVESDGKITALTSDELKIKFFNNEEIFRINDSATKYVVNFFTLRFPFIFINKNSDFEHCLHLKYNSTELPVFLNIKTKYRKSKVKRSSAEAFLSSLEKYSFEARKQNYNSLLLSEKPSILVNDDSIIIKNEWKVISFIGEKQKISIEN